ncbi:MAG TPA: glycosyltransferase family 2 protein [Streptosporangiaceae bacterium]|jgi:hypothetical protein
MTAPEGRAGPGWLAGRYADYIVLDSDPDVPQIAADYWELSADSYARVHAHVRAFAAADQAASAACQRLAGAPADPARWRAAQAALAGLLGSRPAALAAGTELVAGADARIWIDHWLGAGYQPAARPYRLADLPPAVSRPASSPRAGSRRAPRAVGPPQPAGSAGPGVRASAPRVHVVIPFRDNEGGVRLRNLAACLHALRDQDYPASLTQVTVVETDTRPRWREVIEPLASRYLHAHKDGDFNKSWTINVGLRSGGRPGAPGTAELSCVLDADILVDRSFLTRNAARLAGPQQQAHLPFRWSLSLDEVSTDRALRIRVAGRAARVDEAVLRGLLLREPPGGCLWARTALLHRIGGYDERFEGWGGEDDDMAARISQAAPLARFGDPLLHLNHPRPVMVRADGQAMNAHLLGDRGGAPAWTGAAGFGDPARFAAAGRPAEDRR